MKPARFATLPLSGGLDIVRKTLGQHAIAVLQSTAIDPTTRLVILTTMLAHGSGQWVSSEWPVCRSDQSLPQHRMGAALTYARRYALFSLVGIAGEDDIDAPDLLAITTDRAPPGVDSGPAASTTVSRRQSASVLSQGTSSAIPIGLSPADSAAARDELLQGLASLASSVKAVEWARRGIKRKNALTTEDAAAIESAFASRLKELERLESETPGGTAARSRVSAKPSFSAGRIDKSALTIGEPKRLRDKAHLRFVASQPCLVCGRQPSDAHHLRFAQLQALGLKVSDEFTVPLCRGHHRQVHQTGNEAGWWVDLDINALEVAKGLWAESRGLRKSESIIPADGDPT